MRGDAGGSRFEGWAAFVEADRLIAGGRAFEAHELLETPWLAARGRGAAPAPDPARALALRVALHVAAAHHHALRGNVRGARAQYARARRALERLGDAPVAGFTEARAALAARLAQLADAPMGAPPALAAQGA